MTILIKKKLSYLSNLTLTIILFVSTLTNFMPFVEAMGAEKYDGDKYITQSKLTKQDGGAIYDGDTMKIEEVYYLTYDWEVPDNTFYQNDVLTFSIPKEFKIVNQFTFPLFDLEGEEVALASVLGNDSEGYYINMEFTTDYVENYSSVSGLFKMAYKLNQTYVKGDEIIKLPLPEGDITVNVPEYNSPGGGGGIGAGDSQTLAKSGEVMDKIKYNPVTGKYDLPQRVVEWEVNLGIGRLMDAIGDHNIDQVDRVVIEDSPKDQQIVSMTMYQENWSDDDWGWEKAFFQTIDFDYKTIKENTVELKMDHTNTYCSSFSYNIWPYIQKELDYAIKNDTILDEVAINYDTEPLELLTENTQLQNDATVKIYYKDGSEGEKWTLSESVDWNVAEGEINGKVSDVSFKKIDGDTGEKLPGATFDLYKKGLDGTYTLKKANITSDANGVVTANKLTTGDYYFEETKSPEGYQDPENPKVIEFKVETKDSGGSQNIKELGEVKNFQENSKINISVEKKWEDGKNQDGIRSKNIDVQLYGNNQPVGNPVTLDENNNWQYTWSELNEKENGTVIRYEVKELSTVPGYEVEINGNGTNSVVITNKHTPEVIDIKGKKSWNDDNDRKGNRPSELVVELYANNQLVDTQQTTAQKNWSYEFTNLPKNENGKVIEYTVKEQAISDYQPEYNGYDITNNYSPELTEFSAKKTWDDKDNQDGIRPKGIQVQLKGNNKTIGDPVTLNEENEWSHTWEGLEKRENGTDIHYTVEEVSDLGKYTVEMTKDGDYEAVLTNHYTPEVTEVRGQKIWDDNQDEKGNRPNKIVVELYEDGKLVDKQETNALKNWSYSFTNLPKNNQGKLIHYEVKEQDVEDYEVSYSGFDMTNKYNPVPAKVSVQKKWNDKDDQDGIRPDEIQVQLKRNGKTIGDPVTLNEKNEWNHTWEGLEKRENGQKINYTVEEVSDPGKYKVEVTKENEYQITLTNNYKPEETEIRGNKIWEDNDDQDGMRPAEIKVHLIANGRPEPVETKTVKPDKNGDWTYEFIGLPKKEKGKDIVYSIKEKAVPNYQFSAEEPKKDNELNIVNKHNVRKTFINVTKEWRDNEDQDGLRPQSIYVQFLADGEKVGEPVELNNENQWRCTWKDLDERKSGKVIDYSVEEITIDSAYESSIEKKEDQSFTIVNMHVPEETEIHGIKTWDDNDDEEGQRPDQIVVRLYGDGHEVAKKTVTKEDNWAYSFTNLQKNNKGQEINYTVREDAVQDYTPEVNGTDIVNKYTPGETDISVVKKWIDGNNQDGIRPEKILVQLQADGLPIGEPVSLSEQNNWTHIWEGLVAKAYGKDVQYTVVEIDVPEKYHVEIDDTNKEEIIISNIHVPETIKISGNKYWVDDQNKHNERPDSITVNLMANGEKIASKEVTKDGNWQYEFSDLPKYEKGKEIVYTVTENDVPNYTSKIDGFDITNTYTPKEKIPETPSNNGPSRPEIPSDNGNVSTRTLPRTGSKATHFYSVLGVILIVMMLTFAGWFKLCKNS
ncbi:Cna B-type domain-containing protein [Enterococcus ureasiticus]|uniref:Gram-positive cocci surface proteins LPxTG domain-containing protein n=1 Tax=Enterococcus ureasiticus TaxID=903984 RepID=A0A1E5GH34_9ENTE|nr:Cna B-type domain-containing protein [Enterococcus ureasiticus]OEG11905.1 hypothetical protein BCR21_06630 [Enterococcus ureasiticus]